MEMNAEQAAALFAWYRAMGVDEIIGDAPYCEMVHEPFAQRGAMETASPLPLNASHEVRETSVVPANPDAMVARDLASTASSISDLRAILETFDGCGLKKTAKRLCFSRGAENARVMLIGEAPGKDEDDQGLPFVGRAGQLLDRMLASIQLSEADCYITNLVFWRPPGNRTPSLEEVQVCLPFVKRQIDLVKPQILVFLGNAAAKQLTGATDGILKLRGRWLSYKAETMANETPIRAMATLHPAYLLRTPIAKRLAWRDLLLIREALDANPDAA